MPLVSVILPTCDRPKLWPRALDSVLNQTWADFEVILVDSNRVRGRLRDDPSLPGRLADPRVVLVEKPHAPNAAAARNVGLAAARGDWITYLDDDDAYLPEKISAQLTLAGSVSAPLVLCGYIVNMPRRRRTRQVSQTAFRGDALLNDANWGTPMLFHRRDPAARFDESLRAGHDEFFAHAFICRHNVQVVPNCARSLVDVFPQVGATRVHRGDRVWPAYRATWELVHTRYSHAACRRYLAKGRLVRAQGGHGSRAHFLACASAVLATHGPGGWRLVANASAHRFGLLSKWVVS